MKQTILSSVAAALCTLASSQPLLAQTTTIDSWSNHGNPPTITVGPNSGAACGLVNVTTDPNLVTDVDPDNFTSFLSVLSADCQMSIRTPVLTNPGTSDVPASAIAPRYAGYFLGGDFAAVSTLTDITLRTYDDGVLAESVTSGGAGVTIVDLGDDNFFVYFEARAPFDDVEIEFGSLVSAVEDLEVYYAFATAGTGTFGPVSNVPLSLENTALRAQAITNGVQLSWDASPSTYTRIVVERSTDDTHEMLVIAALPSTALRFFDVGVSAGQRHIYRLRMERADGSAIYSSSAAVFVKAVQGSDWTVWPNPAADVLNIGITQSGEYGVTMRNATGNTVFRQTYVSNEKGALVLPREIMQIAAGVYLLELSTPNGESLHQRVVLR